MVLTVLTSIVMMSAIVAVMVVVLDLMSVRALLGGRLVIVVVLSVTFSITATITETVLERTNANATQVGYWRIAR